MNNSSTPIFLVGSERSGTTLLRLMLDSHPQIAWYPEFEQSVERMGEDSSFPAIEDYHQWLKTSRNFQMSGMTLDRQLNYPDLIKDFLNQYHRTTNKPFIGATVHTHFDRLLAIWPTARFIHLVRDPRDVSKSCVAMGWAGNVWSGLERWMTAEDCWTKLKSKLDQQVMNGEEPTNNKPRSLEITYKDLISQNRETLENICTFIGTDYSSHMLDYPHSSAYELPDASRLRQWRRSLSKKEVQLVEARVGQQMVDRGFTLSEFPQRMPSNLYQHYLSWQNRWGKLIFRVNYYGLPLFLADFFTRRLKLEKLNQPLRLKMNAIEIESLKDCGWRPLSSNSPSPHGDHAVPDNQPAPILVKELR